MTQSQRYVGASTKAYMGYARTLEWLDGIAAELDARPLSEPDVALFVIPSFPLIPAAIERLGSRGVVVGAQTVSWGDGALTGEVSAALLAEMGIGLVEIGHAERRRLFGETDEIVARKVLAALDAGIAPLLCVGEPQRGTVAAAVEFCLQQVLSAIGGSDAQSLSRLETVVVAYEPIWAIGASEPADADYVSHVVAGLRAAMLEAAQAVAVQIATVAVIYGGSAGPGLLAKLPDVDGLFLGRFAHDPKDFMRVVDEARALVTGN